MQKKRFTIWFRCRRSRNFRPELWNLFRKNLKLRCKSGMCMVNGKKWLALGQWMPRWDRFEPRNLKLWFRCTSKSQFHTSFHPIYFNRLLIVIFSLKIVKPVDGLVITCTNPSIPARRTLWNHSTYEYIWVYNDIDSNMEWCMVVSYPVIHPKSIFFSLT